MLIVVVIMIIHLGCLYFSAFLNLGYSATDLLSCSLSLAFQYKDQKDSAICEVFMNTSLAFHSDDFEDLNSWCFHDILE